MHQQKYSKFGASITTDLKRNCKIRSMKDLISKLSRKYWCNEINANAACLKYHKIYHHNNNFYLKCVQLISPWSRYLVSKNFLNLCSGNGLLPDGTKAKLKPILTYHERVLVAFIAGYNYFLCKCSKCQSLQFACKLHIKITSTSPRGQWVKHGTMI